MMSQNFEEMFILQYFYGKPPAKFIDIGAFHVEQLSNTRELYKRLNWAGVLVEPSPSNFKSIQEHYKKEPRIEVLQLAIGEKTKEIDFYESSGDAVSTSDVNHMKLWGGAGVKFSKIKVQQMAVQEFMEKYCTPDVEFISCDVEATNVQLFRLIPDFVFEQINAFCIEHDNCQEEIRARLDPFGFKEVYINAENIILCKDYVMPEVVEEKVEEISIEQ